MDGGFWYVGPTSATSDTWVSLTDPRDMMGEELTASVRSGATPVEPVALGVWNRGRHRGDLLWTGAGFVVASYRFLEVLSSIGATGWTSVSATITYADGSELPGYRVLVVTGQCATFLGGKDMDDDEEYPVDASQGWDGSDVFWEAGGPHSWRFITTDRVRRSLLDAGLVRLQIERPYR